MSQVSVADTPMPDRLLPPDTAFSSSPPTDHDFGGLIERRWRGRSRSRSRQGDPEDWNGWRSPTPDSRSRQRSGTRSRSVSHSRSASWGGEVKRVVPEDEPSDDSPSPLVDPSVSPETESVVLGKITYFPSRPVSTGAANTFIGRFQGRHAAVRRLPRSSPWREEVADLEQIDAHPNIQRLFAFEEDTEVLLANELCGCSLSDLVLYRGRAKEAVQLRARLFANSLSVLTQLLNALDYIHSVGRLHLNLKAHNVLIPPQFPGLGFRIVIGDFGLLARDPEAFPTDLMWSAPEILARASLKGLLPDPPNDSAPAAADHVIGSVDSLSPETLPVQRQMSFRRPSPTALASEPLGPSADIFSAGLIAFFILTRGAHPFPVCCTALTHPPSLSALLTTPSPEESLKLVKWMLKVSPKARPSARIAVHHPLFWPSRKRLEFLRVAADRVKIEPLDSPMVSIFEREAAYVFGEDWLSQLHPDLGGQLTKVSKYDPTMLRDLLKAVRNCANHWTEFPDEARKVLDSGVYAYFGTLFPKLLMAVFKVVYKETQIGGEPGFRGFLETDTIL